jgi:hypothetical protein
MIFIESKIFEKLREKYFDDTSYREFQNFLLEQPDVGDTIQGTGGLKKVRWAANGKGKRGGIRTIYLYLADKSHIHLLTVYAKNEMSDLTSHEKKILKVIAEEIKNA